MVRLDGDALAFLFRYGVVVTLGTTADQWRALAEQLKPLITSPFEKPIEDHFDLVIRPKERESVTDSGIVVHSLDVERIFVIADVLAKSVVLEHYEERIGEVFERVQPLAVTLQKSGRAAPRGRELLQHVGQCLLIQHHTVWRVEVEDKPEITWDHPDLERLHVRIADEYEIHERHQALERKLQLLARTAETLVSLLQQKRSLRVEWYIVILIVVEILLMLYEMLV